MKITAIEAQRSQAERVNVHVDGVFRLALAAELAFSEHLHVGDEITSQRLAELDQKDHAWKAREAAIVLLSFRPRTAVELQRRLAQKGYAPDVVEPVVTSLTEMGLVDDAAFASTFVRDRVRLRPKGKRVLAQELRMKGVDPETAAGVIEEVLEREEVSDVELARQAAARWRPRSGEDPLRARRRLHGFLARRGFGGDAIRAVMDETLADADSSEDME